MLTAVSSNYQIMKRPVPSRLVNLEQYASRVRVLGDKDSDIFDA